MYAYRGAAARYPAGSATIPSQSETIPVHPQPATWIFVMLRTPDQQRRARTDADLLARHYPAIGPAAILAALVCMPRTRIRNGRPLRA